MRAIITLNRNYLKHNYNEIKRKTGKEIIAVIKSNAYGHGIKELSKELSYLNCPFFVVSSIQEAITTRKNLIYVPILLLEDCDDYRIMISLNITLAIFSLAQLKKIVQSNYPLMIQLCVDVGIKRDGETIEEIDEAKEIIKNSKLRLMGIFAHHTGVNNYNKECELFKNALSKFDKKIFFHHKASNLIKEKDLNENDKYLRIGGAILGLNKIENFNLLPVLSLSAPIYSVKEIENNTPIGYDDGKKTYSSGYLISIPFGYGDGWPKYLTLVIYYKGKIFSSVGGRMMNHTLFVIDKNLKPKVGEMVELIGEHLNVFELAKIYNMIPYEVTTTLSSSLKKEIK